MLSAFTLPSKHDRHPMNTNHPQFIDAMTRGMLIRARYHAAREDRVVEHVCAPVHFGPEPGSPNAEPRYWIWDFTDHSGSNPIDLTAEDLESVQVLTRAFDPATFSQVSRTGGVARDRAASPVSANA